MFSAVARLGGFPLYLGYILLTGQVYFGQFVVKGGQFVEQGFNFYSSQNSIFFIHSGEKILSPLPPTEMASGPAHLFSGCHRPNHLFI